VERKLEDGSSLISRDGWKVRPGYSSGASSIGSDVETDDLEDNEYFQSASRHSDILALSTLRQEMAKGGDIGKIVVRIEVRSF